MERKKLFKLTKKTLKIVWKILIWLLFIMNEFILSIWKFTVACFGMISKVIKEIQESSKDKCPRCDSTNLNYVEPSFWQKAKSAGIAPWGKPAKTLNVCRDCGFSWEDR